MKQKMSAEQAAVEGTLLGEPYKPPDRTGTFDVPSYDDIADLNQLFKRFANTAVANGGDTMIGTYNFTGKILVNGQPLNPSDAYELSDRTAGFTVTIPEVLVQTRYMCNFSTDQTIAMPADGSTLPDGARITIVQTGKGKITINGLNVTGTQKTKLQYQALEVMWHGSLWWCLAGGGGGGGGEGTPVKPVIAFDANFETINWSPVTGTAGPTLGYGALVTPSDGVSWAINGTTLTLLRATAGIAYSFEVWGVNAAGQGDISDPVSHTWSGAAAPVLTCVSGSASFTANWNAIPGADAYVISYRKQSTPEWTEVDLGAVTTKTITGLLEEVPYRVRVQALNIPIASPWSNEEVVTPGPGIPDSMQISHSGVRLFTIDNHQPGSVYSVVSGVATTISPSGLVTLSDDGIVEFTVALALGAPTKSATVESKAYTYSPGSPSCNSISFECRGDCPGGGCSCYSQGCTCACTYYPSGECAGLYGYQRCNCNGCPPIKNGTPAGYTDSEGEWWKKETT